MNMLKRVFGKCKMLVAGAVAAVSTSVAHAQAAPENFFESGEDIGTVLQGHLTTIWVIAGVVATICIGIALVKVGIRFFKKAG